MFYAFAHKVLRLLWSLLFKVEFRGLDYVPTQGGFILCCNHLHAMDPTVICLGIPASLPVHYIGKEELFRHGWQRFLFQKLLGAFPVNRGTGDMGAVNTAIDIVRQGGVLGIFPEGTRSRDGSLLRFKSGLSLIAQQSGGDVLPCYISYPQGLHFRSPIIVTYGPVISNQSLGFSGGNNPRELRTATRRLREAVASLSPLPLPEPSAPKED